MLPEEKKYRKSEQWMEPAAYFCTGHKAYL